ncbi:hypothetical protein M0R89_10425 [Halorussus limi]|uniref:Uncharacterized protein n=1 Tax=Halorussus limi TaxID=2938695 RepID=A0A8U0HQE4_9EURY|nr:hypothetical protein [Halorussus limi]UPV72963.1 hypothetical protein M0R89_10425 [Halorussus limi]
MTAATTESVGKDRIDRHYENAAAVYRELGRMDGLFCPATADFQRWYATKPDAPDGYAGRKRPHALGADYQQIREKLERVLYSTVNYAEQDFYMGAWKPFNYADDGGFVWPDGESPNPDYGDLRAYAPFADVDLADDVKHDRPDGEIPKDAIEDALDRYIGAFAELAGDRDAVFALDSVGGAYVMVAPSVAAPIADEFDRDDRARLMQELPARVNEWLENVSDRVTGEVPETEGVFEPDHGVNHKNRAYKAPLSLHASMDGVVTPIDTDTPAYDYTPLSAVGQAERDAAKEWAARYTSDYSDRVGALVAALWPDYSDNAETWRDALEAWLADTESDDANESDPADADVAENAPSGSVGNWNEVYRALDSLDATRVAEKTIVSSWNENATSGKGKGFYPTWGPNSNGTANYVTDDIWHDTGKDGGYGTVIEMALIGANKLNHAGATPVNGKKWFDGYRELLRLGFDLPLLKTGCDDDMSDYYAYDLKAVAVEHGLDESAVYSDPETLLKACLLARDEYDTDLSDAKPPYKALVGVAEQAGLRMEDPDDGILGENTHSLAQSVYADMNPSDVEVGQ